MQIRPIEAGDVAAVAALLQALARRFIVHEATPEGAATFLRENDAAAIGRYIAAGMVYHVAQVDGALAGFIAVRERSHLYHMFVDAPWQRRGIGRQMWAVARQAACDAGGDGRFTVNASNYAVPAYHALGFARTAPMQTVKGLPFNPMAL
ncbi:MAG: GNAT family N-acetyltransferase [Pseudomonadota bacterium]|nr:GNAT family N-acetyltransferase [Pseudomonadota bacterium]